MALVLHPRVSTRMILEHLLLVGLELGVIATTLGRANRSRLPNLSGLLVTIITVLECSCTSS